MNKISSFETMLLTEYAKQIKEKFPETKSLEQYLDEDKLKIFRKSFLKSIDEHAVKMSKNRISKETEYGLDSDQSDILYTKYEEYNREQKYKEAIQNACIYVLATQDETLYDYIKEVLKQDIESTVENVKNNKSFSDYTMQYYYNYLKERISNDNFEEITMFVLNDHDWLVNLESYKGYLTINDLLRDVLAEICHNHIKGEFVTDEVCKELDLYFTTTKHDYYLHERFQEVLDEDTIKAYKRYQFNILMSDAYTFLKYASLRENEYPLYEQEIEILEELENAIETRDFSAFQNPQKRRFVYNEFWVNVNDDFINARRSQIKFLIEAQEEKVLKLSNPLFFLE